MIYERADANKPFAVAQAKKYEKDGILADLDNLDYEDKHFKRRKADLENRLSKTYDKIEETENAQWLKSIEFKLPITLEY